MLAEEHHQAVFGVSRAIELAEKLGATETLVHALNNVGTAELIAQNEQGRIKLEESLRLALANNLQDHAGRAYHQPCLHRRERPELSSGDPIS